jgi:tape measure domain-containing protein
MAEQLKIEIDVASAKAALSSLGENFATFKSSVETSIGGLSATMEKFNASLSAVRGIDAGVAGSLSNLADKIGELSKLDISSISSSFERMAKVTSEIKNDSVTKLSASLSSLSGLSVEGISVQVEQLSKSLTTLAGVNVDTVSSSMSKIKDSTTGITEASQKLDLLSSTIKSVPSETVNKISADLKSLQAVDLSKASEELRKTTDSITKTSESTIVLGTAFQQIKAGEITNAAKELEKLILVSPDKLTKDIETLKNEFVNMSKADFSKTVTELKNLNTAGVGSKTTSEFVNLLSASFANVKSDAVKKATDDLNTLRGTKPEEIAGNVTKLSDATKSVSPSNISELAQAMAKVASINVDSPVQAFAKIGETINALSNLLTALSTAIENFGRKTQSDLANTNAGFTNLVDGVNKAISAITNLTSLDSKFSSLTQSIDKVTGSLKLLSDSADKTKTSALQLAASLDLKTGDASLVAIQQKMKAIEDEVKKASQEVITFDKNVANIKASQGVLQITTDLRGMDSGLKNSEQFIIAMNAAINSIPSTTNLNSITTQANQASAALQGVVPASQNAAGGVQSLTGAITPLTGAATSASQTLHAMAQQKLAVAAAAHQASTGVASINTGIALIGSQAVSAVTGLSQLAAAFGPLGAATAIVVGLTAAIMGLAKPIIEATQQVTNFKNTIDTFAGAGKGDEAFKKLSESADKAGQSIQVMATEAKKMIPVMLDHGQTLDESMKKIGAFEKAFTALGLSQDQTKHATLALTQAMSSGTLHLQELNQLANAVPGAFKLIADSMNLTEAGLRKATAAGQIMGVEMVNAFAKISDSKFAELASKQAASLGAELTRLSNDAFHLANAFGSGALVGAVNGAALVFSGLHKILANPIVTNVIKAFGDLAGILLGALGGAIQAIAAAFTVLSNVLGVVGSGLQSISSVFLTVGQVIRTWVTEGIKGWVEYGKSITDSVIKAFSSLGSLISQGLTSASSVLSSFFSSAITLITSFSSNINSAFSLIGTAISNITSFFQPLSEVLKSVSAHFSTFGESVKNAALSIPLVASALQGMSEIWSAIVSGLELAKKGFDSFTSKLEGVIPLLQLLGVTVGGMATIYGVYTVAVGAATIATGLYATAKSTVVQVLGLSAIGHTTETAAIAAGAAANTGYLATIAANIASKGVWLTVTGLLTGAVTALKAALIPLLPLIGAISAVIGVAVVVMTQFDGVSKAAGQAMDYLKGQFNAAKDSLSQLTGTATAALSPLQAIQKTIKDLGDSSKISNKEIVELAIGFNSFDQAVAKTKTSLNTANFELKQMERGLREMQTARQDSERLVASNIEAMQHEIKTIGFEISTRKDSLQIQKEHDKQLDSLTNNHKKAGDATAGHTSQITAHSNAHATTVTRIEKTQGSLQTLENTSKSSTTQGKLLADSWLHVGSSKEKVIAPTQTLIGLGNTLAELSGKQSNGNKLVVSSNIEYTKSVEDQIVKLTKANQSLVETTDSIEKQREAIIGGSVVFQTFGKSIESFGINLATVGKEASATDTNINTLFSSFKNGGDTISETALSSVRFNEALKITDAAVNTTTGGFNGFNDGLAKIRGSFAESGTATASFVEITTKAGKILLDNIDLANKYNSAWANYKTSQENAISVQDKNNKSIADINTSYKGLLTVIGQMDSVMNVGVSSSSNYAEKLKFAAEAQKILSTNGSAAAEAVKKLSTATEDGNAKLEKARGVLNAVGKEAQDYVKNQLSGADAAKKLGDEVNNEANKMTEAGKANALNSATMEKLSKGTGEVADKTKSLNGVMGEATSGTKGLDAATSGAAKASDNYSGSANKQKFAIHELTKSQKELKESEEEYAHIMKEKSKRDQEFERDAQRAIEKKKESIEVTKHFGVALSAESIEYAKEQEAMGRSAAVAGEMAFIRERALVGLGNLTTAEEKYREKLDDRIKSDQELYTMEMKRIEAIEIALKKGGMADDQIKASTQGLRERAKAISDGSAVDVKAAVALDIMNKVLKDGITFDQARVALQGEIASKYNLTTDGAKELTKSITDLEIMNSNSAKTMQTNKSATDQLTEANKKLADGTKETDKKIGDMAAAISDSKSSITSAASAFSSFSTSLDKSGNGAVKVASQMTELSKLLPTMKEDLALLGENVGTLSVALVNLSVETKKSGTELGDVTKLYVTLSETFETLAESSTKVATAFVEISKTEEGLKKLIQPLEDINDKLVIVKTSADLTKKAFEELAKVIAESKPSFDIFNTASDSMVEKLRSIQSSIDETIKKFNELKSAAEAALSASKGASGASGGGTEESSANSLRDGGYSDKTATETAKVSSDAFKSAPKFDEGTTNTSSFSSKLPDGGIPSILHPNEAVIPLSAGRSIPVEMKFDSSKVSGDAGKTSATDINSGPSNNADFMRPMFEMTSSFLDVSKEMNRSLSALSRDANSDNRNGNAQEILTRTTENAKQPNSALPVFNYPLPSKDDGRQQGLSVNGKDNTRTPSNDNSNSVQRGNVIVHMTINATDVDSFKRSESQIIQSLSRKMATINRQNG